MTRNPLLKTLLAILLLVAAQNIYAQYKPAAVFVMLNSEQNRINDATKLKRTKDLEETIKDRDEVIKATKNDYRDRYNVSPVFYFMDTNKVQVGKGELDGVILNEDGTVATNYPKSGYIVAYYGYPDFHTDPDALFRKGLVIINDKNKQLTNGSIYIKFSRVRKKAKYSYNSKHFDIEYRPVASILGYRCRHWKLKRKTLTVK